jgi:peptide/nickel transport system substrate-binding protein
MATDDSLRRRSFLKAAGGATAAATLAGCTGGDGNQEETTETTEETDDETTEETDDETTEEMDESSGGTLTYARGSSSGSLDFQNTTSGEVAKVTNQIYDGLVQFEPGETNIVAGLATEYNVDGETITMSLREGVQFHNGEEFTADDYVATYERFTNPDHEYYPGDDYVSAYGSYSLGTIDSVEKQGDYELEITLAQPYAPMIPNLAMFCSRVHSQAAIEEYGTDLAENPVGTGPFQFDNWDQGNERIRLSANDDYWGEVPKVDEVVFTVVGENNSRAQTLDSGGADIIDGLGAGSSKIVENSSNAELVSMPGINVGYMAFNMSRFEPFQTKEVRQAINYAIDTQAIVENIFQGIASQASQPIPDSVMGYNSDLDPYPHDPDQAVQLLEDAGYGDGFEFELATFQNPRTYNPSPIQAAQTVKSNIESLDVDISVEINQMPFDPFLEYTDTYKHDACFLGWMTDNADPDNFYYALLHPGVDVEDVPEGQDWINPDEHDGVNTLDAAAWANTEFMQVVEEAQTSYETGDREPKYQQAAEIFHEEVPWVAMDHAKELRGVGNHVEGFKIAPIAGPFLNLVSLNE